MPIAGCRCTPGFLKLFYKKSVCMYNGIYLASDRDYDTTIQKILQKPNYHHLSSATNAGLLTSPHKLKYLQDNCDSVVTQMLADV